jgi:hypothetical protein
MLAYVFWHRPAPGVRVPDYESALAGFHRALGRPGSLTFHLACPPWDASEPPVYEDWYPVADWQDLGRLEQEAVSGPRRPPHDAAAQLSGWGAGGVMSPVRSGAPFGEVRFAAWLSKPEGMSYDAFFASLDEALAPTPQAAVWQRRLVLGPQPEFAVLSPGPVSLPWRTAETEPSRAAP